MQTVNKVILLGHLGRDPEIRSFQNGGRVAQLSVATNERWRDRTNNEMREKVEWHRVTVYQDRTIDFIEKHMKKGSSVYVEGKLETRKWTDQAGQERYTTEIVVRNFSGEVQLLDRLENDGASSAPRASNSAPASRGMNGTPPRGNANTGGGPLDSDIPF